MAAIEESHRQRSRCASSKEICSGRPDRFGKTKTASRLLRALLSANVCFGHDSGAQSGLASIEGCSSSHLGSATRATIADTRVFWYAVADANKHAVQEKGQRETQKEESAQVASGFPKVRRRRFAGCGFGCVQRRNADLPGCQHC